MDNLNELIVSAGNGDIEAMIEVANYIVWDDETQEIEPELLERALGYLHTAIENGNDIAMNSLGAMYYQGRGVEQDYSKAVYWYTEAANRGNVTSMSNLGYCYYYGRDIPVDYEKAYQMYTKAAIMGDLVAEYKVGDMFASGKYVAKDDVSAFRIYYSLFERTKDDTKNPYCQEVYSGVCLRLGSCLHKGKGAEINLEAAQYFLGEAKQHFKARCDRGDFYAKSGLKQATEEWIEVTKGLEE